MRCCSECTVEKEGNEVQYSEAHRRVGEEYIFRMRQGGTIYSEYNNDGSLGKSTQVLIGVWNREKNENSCQTMGGNRFLYLVRERYQWNMCFIAKGAWSGITVKIWRLYVGFSLHLSPVKDELLVTGATNMRRMW